MNRRILIANRGEIALRVIRACRELGDIPLAIYSHPDRQCLHVAKADQAYCVGEGPSAKSYLNTEAVLKAAKEMKADAVHPGYGFLSENAGFAKAVKDAGMIFIGPTPEVINSMGDKVRARQTMIDVGLPLIPGTTEGETDENKAFEQAKEVGFPIMIKAVAGGGGRGMRMVEKEEDFISNFKRATSEATKAFGDGRMYLERFIRAPHHIEVQVIGDSHGNVCHLFERECSVQRRHQKVIEESPSPFLKPETREKICEASVDACKKLGYQNAGTIEFLVDEDQSFYFMEMNTRLQVEHPVTELVTGIDIVKAQIDIAFGAEIPFKQEDVKIDGHALEYRIYAEDPERFLPQAGLLRGVKFPRGKGVRIDSHVYRGYEIPIFYDSMIAKLSVWGKTREEAIDRSRAVLRDTLLNGIKTNIPFHIQLIENEVFRGGNYTTKILDEHFRYEPPVPDKEELKLAMIAAAVKAYQKEFKSGFEVADKNSRWREMARKEGLR